MGYSCATSADNALKFLMDMITDPNGSSNTWEKDGESYFYEIGRENPDGAVTGTVYRNVGANRCRKAGTFRIDPDGRIVRFPHAPAVALANVRAAYEGGHLDGYHLRRRVA